jgi:cell division protein FtsW (lipid II flippase)
MYGSKQSIDDDAYQVTQAKIAIAKGGLVGVGPGNSTQRDFLPQAYNDFIYPIIMEEYGLIGGAFIYLSISCSYGEASEFLKDVLMHSVHSLHWGSVLHW